MPTLTFGGGTCSYDGPNTVPQGVRFGGKGNQKTAADRWPEFRALRAMLKPLLGLTPPAWQEPVILQPTLLPEEDELQGPEGETVGRRVMRQCRALAGGGDSGD